MCYIYYFGKGYYIKYIYLEYNKKINLFKFLKIIKNKFFFISGDIEISWRKVFYY